MKYETSGVSFKEFVGLKPKMYLFLVDNSAEYEKSRDVNINIIATVNHNEIKGCFVK